eukprot:TRINITY_DN40062_c0_g1_i4.p1 TRINITY_DN40062_c0_g1~~TRINITY_DN40062_c0_g1_i4.p1  ORF type:complete len:564 (-),score=125.92 TRINITY_DN40062_c0_g1_i4:79-1770(-)
MEVDPVTKREKELLSEFLREKILPANRFGSGDAGTAHRILSFAGADPVPAFREMKQWVASFLDIYRAELAQMVYPLFVYIYLDLAARNPDGAKSFYEQFSKDFMEEHAEEVMDLSKATSKEHFKDSVVATKFLSGPSKCVIRMCQFSFDFLNTFLHQPDRTPLLWIVAKYFDVKAFQRGPERSGKHEFFTSASDTGINGKPLKGIGDTRSLTEQVLDRKPSEMIPKPTLTDAASIRLMDELRSSINVSSKEVPSICFFTFLNTKGTLTSTSVSKDARFLAGCFADSVVRLWDMSKRDIIPSADDEKPQIPLVPSKKPFSTLVGHSGPVYAADFAPDSNSLLTCSQDGTVRLWNTVTRSCLMIYHGHNYPVWDVAYSAFGYNFVTGSNDRTARLWCTDRSTPLRVFVGHDSDVNTVTLHPNCMYALTGSADRSLRLWDVKSGECARLFREHSASLRDVAISPNGRICASVSCDGVMKLWDIAEGREITSLSGHGGQDVYSLSFSENGHILASGGADMSICLWDVTSMSQTALIEQSYTKKTPVMNISFTRRNLLVGIGAFQPSL